MNYFRTELMRYFVHNYNKMSDVQRISVLQQIPFNTHFNWDFNLISVLSCMGNKSEAIKDLLDYGVPYIAEADNVTPIKHAINIHD